MLLHTPFEDYFIPGLLLSLVVGMGNLATGVLALRRSRVSESAAFVAAAALTIWIVVEMALLRTVHCLQLVYLPIGLATTALSLRLWRMRRSLVRLGGLDSRRFPYHLAGVFRTNSTNGRSGDGNRA